MAKKVRQELVPALGIANGTVETSSAPANREGYDLYLAQRGDAARWSGRIRMRSRCWSGRWRSIRIMRRHGKRWDDDITSMRFIRAAARRDIERSNAAYQRALALEPGRVSAAGFLAANEVETGNLDKAYEDARALVQKRPDNAFAHYSLAYVSRYAGLLDEAQSECDKALAIDSTNYNWRSCSFAFFEQGKAGAGDGVSEPGCGLGVVERGARLGADAAGKDGGSAAGGAADDGKSDVDAGPAASLPEQGASNGDPPAGGAGEERIISPSRIRS